VVCEVFSLIYLKIQLCEYNASAYLISSSNRTTNRNRSPRLAAFGRTATRRVREVGKFGPYLRYKDWLRRRLLDYLTYVQKIPFFLFLFQFKIFYENIKGKYIILNYKIFSCKKFFIF